mmetsp:Transcript_9248/g.25885  ORF Transcript_9248/g.25885 Transcript_9248/m.25885 type:complete len:233 (-) Transcript_9248:116-814(-)
MAARKDCKVQWRHTFISWMRYIISPRSSKYCWLSKLTFCFNVRSIRIKWRLPLSRTTSAAEAAPVPTSSWSKSMCRVTLFNISRALAMLSSSSRVSRLCASAAVVPAATEEGGSTNASRAPGNGSSSDPPSTAALPTAGPGAAAAPAPPPPQLALLPPSPTATATTGADAGLSQPAPSAGTPESGPAASGQPSVRAATGHARTSAWSSGLVLNEDSQGILCKASKERQAASS